MIDTTLTTVTGDPFRFDSTRLGRYKTALAARASTPVDILFVGDSITEGTVGSGTAATPSTRWQGVFMSGQRTRWQPGGVTGGLGFVPAAYASSTMANFWSFTGTVVAGTTSYFGLGGRYRRLASAATATLAVPTGVTDVDLVHAVGSGASTYHYTVDGGASQGPVNTTATLAASSGVFQRITGLSAASTHTIVITADANFTYVEGAYLYNGDTALGLRGWDSGHSAWRALDFDQPNAGGAAQLWNYTEYRPIQPDLVVIALGSNEYGSSTWANRYSPRLFERYLAELINGIRAQCTNEPSTILWEPAFRADDPTLNGALVAPWSEYIQAIRRVAQADGRITLFDASSVMGDQVANVNSYTGTDGLHPTVAGHSALGTALDRVVASA